MSMSLMSSVPGRHRAGDISDRKSTLYEMQHRLLTTAQSDRPALQNRIAVLQADMRIVDAAQSSTHLSGEQSSSSSELWRYANGPLVDERPGKDGGTVYPSSSMAIENQRNWLDHHGKLTRTGLNSTPPARGLPPTVFIARHAEPLVGKCGDSRRLENDFERKVRDKWMTTTLNPQNPPLTRRGLQQAREMGERLLGEGIIHIYCSPMLRAVQTAEAVANVLNIPFRVENGLCEWMLPDWYPQDPRPQMCGMSMHEVIPSCDPAYTPLYDTGTEDVQCKEDLQYPETSYEFSQRLHNTVQHITNEAQGPNGLKFGAVLMITHYSSFDKIISDFVSGNSRAGWETDPMGDKSPPLAGLVKLQKRDDWHGELEPEPRWGIMEVDHDYLSAGLLCDMPQVEEQKQSDDEWRPESNSLQHLNA